MKTNKYDFLIAEAQKLIQERYSLELHHIRVAAALITTEGKVYSALNTRTYQSQLATCAEIISIGMALKDNPDVKIEAIVIVHGPDGYIVSPCGKCREYIADFSDDALVCVPTENDDHEFLPVSDLLPNKYIKRV